MSLADRVIPAALEFANGRATDKKTTDYVVGAAGIPSGYETIGAYPDQYVPASFGNYLTTSNPVYACVTQRASYLSHLPLRLYQYVEGQGHKTLIPRNTEDYLESILHTLTTGRRTKENKPLPRNVIHAMSHARSNRELEGVIIRSLAMEEVFEGALFDLLLHVNGFWTFNRLIRMTSMCLDIWGQSYWFINRGRSGKGDPVEIWWAKPTQVRPLVHEQKYILGYYYTPISGGLELFFEPHETVRIYYPNPNDEFQPLSPLVASRIYADHEYKSMLANLNLHDQGLHPGAIVMPVGDLEWSEEQARLVEKSINDRLAGVDKAHRWATFRSEVKIDRSAVTPKDAEYINGMNYDVEAVARAYDWPIDLLSGKRTYENVEQAFRRAWQTIIIQSSFIAAEIAEQLFPMFSNPGADVPYFDGSRVRVLQESETAEWERDRTQVDLVLTRNEYRASRGLSPVEGGDKLYISSQMTPLDNPVFITGQEQPTNEQPADAEVDSEEPEPANSSGGDIQPSD